MGKSTVLQATVIDIEKRRLPSKHYVYVIQVLWSERNHPIVIYRRYSKFFDLQCRLIEKFPEEGGCYDPRDRLIPFLPGKILFGRSHIRTVAMKRRDLIDVYCQKLIKLPIHISECEEVLEFFDITASDMNPIKTKPSSKTLGEDISAPMVLEQYTVIADYTKEQSNEVTVTAGMIVEVIDKNLSGWWLISIEDTQGWVPASYLEPLYGDSEETVVPPETEENFICRQSYKPAEDDEVELLRGQVVTVLQKNMDGWWNVRNGELCGLAPAALLQRVRSRREAQLLNNNRCHPVTMIRTVMDLSKDQNSNDETGAIYEEIDESKVSTTREYQVASVNTDISIKRKDNRKKQPPKRSSIKRSVKKINAPPPRPDPPKYKKTYVTIADFEFTGGTDDGISFSADETVQVHERSSTGWWYVSIGDQCGWAPATYIEEKKIKIASTSNCPGRPPPPTVKSRDSSPANLTRQLSPRSAKSQDSIPSAKSRDQSPNNNSNVGPKIHNQRNFGISKSQDWSSQLDQDSDIKVPSTKARELELSKNKSKDDYFSKSKPLLNSRQRSPSLPTESSITTNKPVPKKPELPIKPAIARKPAVKTASKIQSEENPFSSELAQLLAKQRVKADSDDS
ncbi:SH3 and PX domain-containing protein 2B-like [Tubulanus polymorphus]|uniref:SH3 and PX domain-containing protein 2B-like n=1 Tax=Tubulanus polymorphus TaxID=672921 RepID=UPI003DA459C9